MKSWFTVLFGLLSTSALAQSTSAPELKFDSVDFSNSRFVISELVHQR